MLLPGRRCCRNYVWQHVLPCCCSRLRWWSLGRVLRPAVFAMYSLTLLVVVIGLYGRYGVSGLVFVLRRSTVLLFQAS